MLHTTPFQVVYGRRPPPLLQYTPTSARTGTVDTLLQDRDQFLMDVHECLLQAQAYAKRYYDSHNRALELAVSSWVWFRILHRPAQSLLSGPQSNLSLLFAGPFPMLERVSDVAYRLCLPEHAHIDDVFHVGILKPYHGTPPTTMPPLQPLHHGRLLQAPERVLRSQLHRGQLHILIQWASLPPTEAMSKPVDEFKTSYPDFQLEDELFPKGGRNVMVGNVYQRRNRQD